MNGELIHYGSKKAVDFREEFQTGLFAALDRLLDNLTDPGKMPRDQVRLVLGRLKDGQRNHYSLKALDEYCGTSPEAKIWELVDGVFRDRMNAAT